MPERNPRGHQATIKLGHHHRHAIQATQILKRLQRFVLHPVDADEQARGKGWPPGVYMTKGQISTALALLRKVLPDLASVEVSGNPDKPLMVQVVRFSDGEQLTEPRPVIDMGKLIEMDKAEAIEGDAD